MCESGDFLGHERRLALAVGAGGALRRRLRHELQLQRPRAAEVIVDGGNVHAVRERETVAQIYALEKTLP